MKKTDDKIIELITEEPVITVELSASEYFHNNKEFYIEFNNGDILAISTEALFDTPTRWIQEEFVAYFGWELSEIEKLSDVNIEIYNKLVENLVEVNLMSEIRDIYIADL